MTKAEIEKKRSLARTLFMSGMEQAEIAEKVGISRVTISKWCVADGWKEARAAKSVTRPELVNKLLLTIDALITQVNESGDPMAMAGLDWVTNSQSCLPSLRNLTRRLMWWMSLRCP